jgi:small subunit ribosomal protein S6
LRIYESIIIFHPEATEETRGEVHDKVRGIVERFEGEIQAVDDLGKRKLAYPVKKNKYGQMSRVQLTAKPQVVSELETVYRHAEVVIKHMTSVLTERLLQQRAADAAAPPAPDAQENGRRRR